MKSMYGVAGLLVLGMVAGCGSSNEPSVVERAEAIESDSTPTVEAEPSPTFTAPVPTPEPTVEGADLRELCVVRFGEVNDELRGLSEAMAVQDVDAIGFALGRMQGQLDDMIADAGAYPTLQGALEEYRAAVDPDAASLEGIVEGHEGVIPACEEELGI